MARREDLMEVLDAIETGMCRIKESRDIWQNEKERAPVAGVLSGRLLVRFGAALAVSGGQIVPALDGILAAVHGLDQAQATVALDVGIAVAHGVIAVDGQAIAAAVWAGGRGQRGSHLLSAGGGGGNRHGLA